MRLNIQNGWKRVLLFLLPFLITLIFFQLLGEIVANSLIGPDDLTALEDFLVSLITLAGISGLLWLFLKYIDDESFSVLGLRFQGRKIDLVLGILLGFALVGLGFWLLLLLKEIFIREIHFDASQVLLSLLMFMCVALFEEMVFRGYILRNLMYSYHRYLALLLSALIFAGMHGLNPNLSSLSLLNLFLAGLLLGISYIHTRNLWFPIGLHLSLNFFQTHFGFNVSGQDSFSVVESFIVEENLVNGGAFGFEGSVLLMYAQILAIVGIEFYYSAREEKILKKLGETPEF